MHSNWQEFKCRDFKQSSKWRFGKIHDWLKHLLVGISRTWWDLSCPRIRLFSSTTLVRQANHLSIHGINNCTHGGRRFLCIFPRQQIWRRRQYSPGNARHGHLALDTCRTLLNHSNVLLVKNLTWSSSYRSHKWLRCNLTISFLCTIDILLHYWCVGCFLGNLSCICV